MPFTLQRPAALAITGPGTATVALGSPAAVPVRVTNTGDLPAVGVQVTLRRPGTVAFGSPVVSGRRVELLRRGRRRPWSAPRPRSTPAPASTCRSACRPSPAAFGDVGTVTVSAQAPDADPAPDLGVAVSALSPGARPRPGGPLHPAERRRDRDRPVHGERERRRRGEPTAVLTLPVNLRADPGSPAPGRARLRHVAGSAHGHLQARDDPRGRVAAGAGQRPVGGSAKGSAIVVVAAPGVAAVRAEAPVQTSSAGLTARDSFENADVTEIGAPLLSCAAALPECASALANGTRDNNNLDHGPARRGAARTQDAAREGPGVVDGPARRPRRPADRVRRSVLVGQHRPRRQVERAAETRRSLRAPGGTYEHVNGQVLTQPTDNAGRTYYQSFADVTSLVAGRAAGDWSVADVAVSATAKDNGPDVLRGLVAGRRLRRPRLRRVRDRLRRRAVDRDVGHAAGVRVRVRRRHHRADRRRGVGGRPHRARATGCCSATPARAVARTRGAPSSRRAGTARSARTRTPSTPRRPGGARTTRWAPTPRRSSRSRSRAT